MEHGRELDVYIKPPEKLDPYSNKAVARYLSTLDTLAETNTKTNQNVIMQPMDEHSEQSDNIESFVPTLSSHVRQAVQVQPAVQQPELQPVSEHNGSFDLLDSSSEEKPKQEAPKIDQKEELVVRKVYNLLEALQGFSTVIASQIDM